MGKCPGRQTAAGLEANVLIVVVSAQVPWDKDWIVQRLSPDQSSSFAGWAEEDGRHKTALPGKKKE